MTDTTKEHAAKIARLNDLLRKGGFGGTVYLTQGVRAQGEAFVHDALRAVREFSDFGPENDPYGEHDFGVVFVAEQTAVSGKADVAGQPQKLFCWCGRPPTASSVPE